jgi:hypothetical protein
MQCKVKLNMKLDRSFIVSKIMMSQIHHQEFDPLQLD